MPCNDGGISANSYIYTHDPTAQKKLDEVTAMLCAVMREVEYHDSVDLVSGESIKTTVLRAVPGLEEWWKEHKKIDDARIAREKEAERIANLRQSAMEKLTTEEAEALGLKLKSQITLDPTKIRSHWG